MTGHREPMTPSCPIMFAQVQEQEETRTGRQVILASISTLAAAVKKAEGQIKLDLGADLADADDEVQTQAGQHKATILVSLSL